VASRFEVLLPLIPELDQTGEEQDHVTSLVHYRRMAVIASDLTRQTVLRRFRARVVPFKVMVSIGEVDILLVENGSPLEWRS